MFPLYLPLVPYTFLLSVSSLLSAPPQGASEWSVISLSPVPVVENQLVPPLPLTCPWPAPDWPLTSPWPPNTRHFHLYSWCAKELQEVQQFPQGLYISITPFFRASWTLQLFFFWAQWKVIDIIDPVAEPKKSFEFLRLIIIITNNNNGNINNNK